MLSLRAGLVLLITLATVGFVVGTSIERGQHESHAAPAAKAASPTHTESGGETSGEVAPTGESAAKLAAEAGGHAEYRPFGINIEAIPFIVLAALASLALAALAWARPAWLPGLLLVAASMAAFAVLDVREVVHQSDEGRTGLAVLAGAVAALHAAAALLALRMLAVARRPALS